MTSCAIHSSTGIKLLDPGISLSPSLYEKLVLHKLAIPIDECLSLESPITSQSLTADLERLILSQHVFKSIILNEESLVAIQTCFSALPLSPLAAFKLTIMRQEMPDTYQHSLEVAYCALVLAMNLKGSSPLQQQYALVAGLFHDIGLLHIDPRVLSHVGPLEESGRQQIYAHPVTGHLIIGRLQEWPALIAKAVLEHHERLDASGYPRGSSGNEISPLGQLLGLAELAASIFSRQRTGSLSKHIHVILSLNRRKFSKEIARVLVELAMKVPEEQPVTQIQKNDYSEMLVWLVGLSMHIQAWHSIAAQSGHLPIVELISSRIEQLEHNLASLGIDLQFWGMIDGELHEDRATLQELSVCILEGKWLLNDIAHEIMRKWDKLRPQNTTIQKMVFEWVHGINHAQAA
jgi:putative nucleotidyltransferase with HDIG domain